MNFATGCLDFYGPLGTVKSNVTRTRANAGVGWNDLLNLDAAAAGTGNHIACDLSRADAAATDFGVQTLDRSDRQVTRTSTKMDICIDIFDGD